MKIRVQCDLSAAKVAYRCVAGFSILLSLGLLTIPAWRASLPPALVLINYAATHPILPAVVTRPVKAAFSGRCQAVGDLEVLLQSAAERHGLDVNVIRSLVMRESRGQPCVVSRAGAVGLLQLMPATARALGVRNPLDPAENLDGGARFLKTMLLRYGGDMARALAAYNAGPALVDLHGGIPPIPETRRYVEAILGDVKSGSVPE